MIGGCLVVAIIAACLLFALFICNKEGGVPVMLYGAPSSSAFNPELQDGGALTPGLPLPGAPLNPVEVSTWPGGPQVNNAIGRAGSAVVDASVAAAEPLPPRFETLPELGPQRLWQPTWQGCAPTIVNKSCIFHQPAPRLWARDLNELQFRRSLYAGQDHLFEPVKARQSWIQLLAADARSKKDTYTRASPQNSLSHGTCQQMAQQVPEYTNF